MLATALWLQFWLDYWDFAARCYGAQLEPPRPRPHLRIISMR